MISNILVLLRKDFSIFFRNRAAVSLTFVVPFAMIWIFGQVFGINKKDDGPSGLPLAVVNLNKDGSGETLMKALQAEKSLRILTTKSMGKGNPRAPLTEDDLRPMIEDGSDTRFALVIPEDLLPADRLGLHLKIYSNPRNEIETQMMNGLIQKTVFSNVPQLLGKSLQNRAKNLIGGDKNDAFNRSLAKSIASSFGGNEEALYQRIASGDFGLPGTGQTTGGGGGSAAGGDVLARLFQFDTIQVVGKDVVAPQATRIISGFAMQFLLFALSASASALLLERDQGLFHRLLASPITRMHILVSKFLYGILLGLLQLMVLFTAGHFLFGIDIQNHLPLLVLTCTFAAASCTAFGMLLASLVTTAEAANGLATLSILCMSAIGGAWFPLALMPEGIQKVAHVTLVYWSMKGFDLVLWNQAPLVKLLPTLGVLGAITAGLMTIALWRFQRSRLFD